VRRHCLADGREFNPDEAQISSLNLDAAADLGQRSPALRDFWPFFGTYLFIL
jgi:hypothetical protein